MQEINLEKIYIRAQDKKGNWGSFSIQELHDMGESHQVTKWFSGKIFSLVGAEESGVVVEANLVNMVAILEKLGITVVRMK